MQLDPGRAVRRPPAALTGWLAESGYWLVPGRLMAQRFPGGRDLETTGAHLRALRRAGITHLVSLMEQPEERRHGTTDFEATVARSA